MRALQIGGTSTVVNASKEVVWIDLEPQAIGIVHLLIQHYILIEAN